jgi:hypothetical protein
MIKNTANQKWIVFAFDSTTGLAKTGDAAQITANLRKDYGDAAAITDTNPTELEDGYYAFDLSQAETNADHLLLCPASSTANIVVIGCPAVIYTEPTGRKYSATLAAADVSGNIPVDTAAIQNGLATAENQETIISNQETINTNIGGIPVAVWAVTTRTLTSFGTLVADIAAAVWGYLTSALTVTGSIGKLLTDNVDAPVSERGMILPVMTGRAYSATILQNRTVEIVQGDTPTLTFDFNTDYTGWTPYFGAKSKLADEDYAIDPKAATWTDAAEGQGYVVLTAADTATVGKFLGEIELRNGDSRHTPIKFTLIIVGAVITE